MASSQVVVAWSAFNHLFKSFYFNRTQRGGAVNAGKSSTSRLRSIARWLQRRMVFMTGTTDEQIRESYATRGSDEVEVFDVWVKENGGTIQYGKPINEVSKLGPQSEHGLLENDWDVGKETEEPDAEVIDSWDGLLDMLQDSGDECESTNEDGDDPDWGSDFSDSDWEPESEDELSEDLDDEFVHSDNEEQENSDRE